MLPKQLLAGGDKHTNMMNVNGAPINTITGGPVKA